MKKELDLKFYLDKPNDGFPIYKNAEYSGRYEHHIRISTLDDIDNQIIGYIKSSYNLKTKQIVGQKTNNGLTLKIA